MLTSVVWATHQLRRASVWSHQMAPSTGKNQSRTYNGQPSRRTRNELPRTRENHTSALLQTHQQLAHHTHSLVVSLSLLKFPLKRRIPKLYVSLSQSIRVSSTEKRTSSPASCAVSPKIGWHRRSLQTGALRRRRSTCAVLVYIHKRRGRA